MKSSDKKPFLKEDPITYDDYAQLPDDGKRYELANGVLELMTPAPTPKHQIISTKMLTILMNSCQQEYIIFASPIDLILSTTEARQPNLVMIHRNNIEITTKRGIEGIPNLVAEILSPHSIKIDRFDKLKVYARYRIPEYWIIDPANEVLEQYVLVNNDYEIFNVFGREDTVQSEQIKCVSFTMAEIMDAAADLPG
ncbi:Uma2 family endonuclease [Lederbergia panacisoli]|uniref:Uma2 family endonuclease n=1 Tax=Lederbergia panacisoli TaxID=1255251 RepID=UPI00214AD4B8|nr:Uma2 family endonuclease [Lederbergia panacisoli]MCR2822251.1 Uma2 family endonuclease [Lederbergia panacisoli]